MGMDLNPPLKEPAPQGTNGIQWSDECLRSNYDPQTACSPSISARGMITPARDAENPTNPTHEGWSVPTIGAGEEKTRDLTLRIASPSVLDVIESGGTGMAETSIKRL